MAEPRVHIISRSPSPELDSGEQMRLASDAIWQAGAYRCVRLMISSLSRLMRGHISSIPTSNNAAPQLVAHGPLVQTTFPSFPIPPTPLLGPIDLPPTPPPVLGGLGELGPAFPLPMGTIPTIPTLGADDAPLAPRAELALPVVWRLEQRWDVRASGLPIDLPEDEPIQALCGVPEVVLRFTPHPLFPPFVHTLTVEPNVEDKLVVTVGDLARAIRQALKLEAAIGLGRVSDEQRSALAEAQRYRRVERPPVDRRVDMWGPGEMYLRHLVSLSSASAGQGRRREFAVQFQLIASRY